MRLAPAHSPTRQEPCRSVPRGQLEAIPVEDRALEQARVPAARSQMSNRRLLRTPRCGALSAGARNSQVARHKLYQPRSCFALGCVIIEVALDASSRHKHKHKHRMQDVSESDDSGPDGWPAPGPAAAASPDEVWSSSRIHESSPPFAIPEVNQGDRQRLFVPSCR